jgi:DNA repair protein RadC
MAAQEWPDKDGSDGSGKPLAEPRYVCRESECKVSDLPLQIQPREAITRFGVERVSDDVLLALLLRTGMKGVNVVDLAKGLLRRYATLGAIADASVADLTRMKGIGTVKAQMIKAALELGRRLGAEVPPTQVKITTPADVYRLLHHQAVTLGREIFWVLILNAKNALKCQPVDVTSGILDASLVHPREVFREAIRSSAAAVVLAHNHPSGDPSPSSEDLKITRQLIEAGRVVDIKVLDHVILGRSGAPHKDGYLSLRESGLVSFG